jgi:hypothetical protein
VSTNEKDGNAGGRKNGYESRTEIKRNERTDVLT